MKWSINTIITLLYYIGVLLLNSAKLNNIVGNKCKSDSLLFTGNMATVEIKKKVYVCMFVRV